MKRGRIALAAAMLIGGAFSFSPAPANHGEACESIAGHGYKYCGHHWASYPIRFRVSGTGIPVAAVKAAAAAWNNVWLKFPYPSVDNCSLPVLFCFVGSGTAPVVVQVGSTNPGAPATTVPTLSGEIITAATVNLNKSSYSWDILSGVDLIKGEQPGLTGSSCSMCANVFDYQNVLTHEFGHVLGLEHLLTTCGALADSPDWGQTMYGCTQAGDTSKRTLHWGDILGLTRVAMEL